MSASVFESCEIARMAPAVTRDAFRSAMGSFAAGVTVLTVLDENELPQGMTATAFTSLSLDPPLCLVCLSRRARTRELIVRRGSFGVNVLAQGQAGLSARFASPVADRFLGVRHSLGTATGNPLIFGALAWVECRVRDVHLGGDHDIVVGEAVALGSNEGAPLVHFRGDYAKLSPGVDETQNLVSQSA